MEVPVAEYPDANRDDMANHDQSENDEVDEPHAQPSQEETNQRPSPQPQPQPQPQHHRSPLGGRARTMNGNRQPSSASEARTISHMYVLFSLFIALLAIVSPPGHIKHHHKNNNQSSEIKYSAFNSALRGQDDHHGHGHGHGHATRRHRDGEAIKILFDNDGGGGQFANVEHVARAAATAGLDSTGQKSRKPLLKFKDEDAVVASAVVTEDGNGVQQQQPQEQKNLGNLFGIIQRENQEHALNSNEEYNENALPPFLRWMDPNRKNKNWEKDKVKEDDTKPLPNLAWRISQKFIDPFLLEWAHLSSGRTATEIVDKILTSTPRIITIINLLLAVTYLLHSIVADFFLGEATITVNTADTEFGDGNAAMLGMGGVGASASDRMHRSGRERLGGYLLFKLLLITAVVEPDSLDLLILLSWYTLLAFLRSLSYLAGITTAHTAASGQSPHRGVFKLLVAVLLCDISAATTCAALFHGAGLGMVILLTCDCGLLALDVLTHLARFAQQVLDEHHQEHLAELEARQIQLHEERRNERDIGEEGEIDNVQEDEFDRDEEFRSVSRQLDHEMETREALHSSRLAILDNAAFILELFALVVTIAHFLHVWGLHGVTFNLVDGVLALHLHSAISAFGKKIAERRNHNRIARDLDKCFNDATDMELQKASAVGDVCCICLGTMTMGHVKKVGCGHLYHTQCLREVVERAKSIEAARCPLCRASVLDGRQIPSNDHSDGMPQGLFFGGTTNNAPIRPTVARRNDEGTNLRNQPNENRPRSPTAEVLAGNGAQNQNERALFRLSTEGLLPVWLPIPAFSFEVVRRFPAGAPEAEVVAPPPPINNVNRPEQAQEPSFFRRLLVLAGAIPMSPEEEAAAISQLVDMFPQYSRADLLRELRDRGSAEGVVEAILAGLFAGLARNGAVEGRDLPVVRPQEEVINEHTSEQPQEETEINEHTSEQPQGGGRPIEDDLIETEVDVANAELL